MKPEEIIAALKQIDQLAVGLQTALKHSPAEVRAALSRSGFTFQRRIAIQRTSWVLVGACRKQISQMGGR